MSDRPAIPQVPQPRKITGVNVLGLLTLVKKEVRRFLNVYTQTIIAPVVTVLLYYAIFSLALGKTASGAGDVGFLLFLAPGLIMMTMAQNAFANTSSSIVISKVQGNIVDVLMPPLGPGELFVGFAVGGILRGLAVGIAAWAVISLFVPLQIYSLAHVLVFAVLGTVLLSSLGIAGGIWSEKFDHIAAVTNFVVTPLTFLSGTFYSIGRLPDLWQKIAHGNPFFYMIDGFRYGFIGHADASPLLGMGVLCGTDLILVMLCLWMLRSGYKIKS